MQRVLAVLNCLLLLSHPFDALSLPGESKGSVKSGNLLNNPTLHPFAGAKVSVESLQTESYCGHRDLSSTPKCIHYSYESDRLIETFIVNKDTLTVLEDKGALLQSEGVILQGSYCLGKKCEITADLQGVEHWCVMFLNIDPSMSTADVSFSYQVCVEDDDDKHLILILTITCVGLMLVAFVACLACCWTMRRRKRDNSAPANVIKHESLHPVTVPLLPPPPPYLNHFANDGILPPPPPMVSHAPFRHEPAFQPPLPLSRPPPPSSSVLPPTSGPDAHVQFRQPERKRRPKSAAKIRFPI